MDGWLQGNTPKQLAAVEAGLTSPAVIPNWFTIPETVLQAQVEWYSRHGVKVGGAP